MLAMAKIQFITISPLDPLHNLTFIYNFVASMALSIAIIKERNMSIKSFITALLLCSATIAATAQTENLPRKTVDGKEFYVYKVAKSEGFYTLTQRFDVTQEEIIRYNPAAKNGLKHNQILLIPVTNEQGNTSQDEPVEKSSFKHTIKRGESLYSISKMYNVTIAEILELNPGTTKRINAGDVLRIPQKKKKKSTAISQSTATAPTSTTTPVTVDTNEEYTFHTVARGETLYAISQQHNCSVEDILRSNPGISPKKLSQGSVIRIPTLAKHQDATTTTIVTDTISVTKYKSYKVKKKETFYSIAKKFDIPVEDLKAANPNVRTVKDGLKINIPQQETEVTSREEQTVTDEEILDIYNRIYEKKNAGHINAAVILPFMLQHKPDIKSLLYTEYYKGLLLAVDSLKRQGFSINLTAYDTEGSAAKVKNLLTLPNMKTMDLIIAPDDDEMINLIADFGAQYDINVVNTFSLKNEKVNTNGRVFQTNIPHSYLYAETIDRFIKIFKEKEVIFITNTDDAIEYEFIDGLRSELMAQNIPYRTCEYKETLTQENIAAAIGTSTDVVFVPTSHKKEIPDVILPPLATFAETNPQYNISTFGFPGWLTQITAHLDELYKLDTYLFTRFYVDANSDSKHNFDKKFNYWYSDDMINASPQYGLLGFDTGLYFLQAIAENGKNFANYKLDTKGDAIQTDFRFERINNWSGFINKSFYFVHFSPDMNITKINE